MTAIPGSHYLIETAIKNPQFRAEKKKNNSYTAENNLAELDYSQPQEITFQAGGVFSTMDRLSIVHQTIYESGLEWSAYTISLKKEHQNRKGTHTKHRRPL